MPTKNPEYLRWLRKQDCAVCGPPPDFSNLLMNAHHHTGRRGAGQKADDQHAFPLCSRCHTLFHDGRGFCKDWDNAKRTTWQDEMCSKYWARFNDKEVF